MAIRIVIADDHALIRTTLAAWLARQQGFEIVGEAATGLEAVELSARLCPHVVLMDHSMPGLSGVEATAQIMRLRLQTKCILVSSFDDDVTIQRALRAGVAGYVLKSARPEDLVPAIRAVSNGQVYFSPHIAGRLAHWTAVPTSIPEDPGRALTPRQRQILQLICTGLTTKGIAAELGLSVSTVDTHRSALMRRLGIHDVASLVRFAVEHGLVRNK